MSQIVTYFKTATKSKTGKHPKTYCFGRLKSAEVKSPSEGGYFVFVAKEASSRSGTGKGWAVALPKDPNRGEGRNGVSFEEAVKFFNKRVGFEAYKAQPMTKKIDEALPPHLAKLFDKNGNPKSEAGKKAWANIQKKAPGKAKDVTPKGYGPVDEISKDLASRYNKVSVKDLRSRVAARKAKGELSNREKAIPRIPDDDRKIMNRMMGQRDAKKRMDEARTTSRYRTEVERWSGGATVTKGNQVTYPIHDKELAKIKMLKDGEKITLPNESRSKILYRRMDDRIFMSINGQKSTETSVPVASLFKEEAVNEISVPAAHRYATKAEKELMKAKGKDPKTYNKRLSGLKNAYKKIAEDDQIDELSKDALARYADGAERDMMQAGQQMRRGDRAATRRYDKRHKGYNKANMTRRNKIDEDAPANATGAAVPGTGDTGDAWKKGPLVRRKKFAGHEAFIVDSDTYNNCLQGKKKYAHYKSYVGECDTGTAIRDFGRSNPGAPIIVMDERTGAASFLRYGKKGIKF